MLVGARLVGARLVGARLVGARLVGGGCLWLMEISAPPTKGAIGNNMMLA
jgi:hypothetical protein